MRNSEKTQTENSSNNFISLVAHQLLTPLSTVKWYLETLLGEEAGKLNVKQKKYLQTAYESSDSMVKLVMTFLNVSRIEMGTFVIKPEPTNISEMTDNILKDFIPQVQEKKLGVKRNYDPSLPKINVDPQVLRIILQNLISNAVKYSRKKGTMKVSLKTERPNILIEVSDTGYGIPKDEQQNIFTKMFRATNIRELEPSGTGMGLYITKTLVGKSGGEIRFESEKGEGTTFYVTIPLAGMKGKEGTKPLV